MAESESVEMIDRQRVEELATQFQEPQWLRDSRLQAWERYLQTPMPTPKQDAWRRLDLNALDLTCLRAFDLAPARQVEQVPALPAWFNSALNHCPNNAGVLFQTTRNGGYLKLNKELAQRGVIFCDLATAIQQHAQLIRPYLLEEFSTAMEELPEQPRTDKFNILTRALYNCGAFLYIPKGVEIKEPFLLGLGFSAHAEDIGGAIFPRVFVVAEDNSTAGLVFLMGTEADDVVTGKQTSLASVLVDAHVKAGARFDLLEVQELGTDVFLVEETSSHVGRDASFNSLSVGVGGHQTKADIATYLVERGAASNVLGVILGAKDERFNFNTVQEHQAPDTRSNINYRVAVKDEAVSVYQGTIRVDKCAQRTDAYQSNKNLILGGDASADSVPRLEILANDVKCSHGATVGPIDREQLFYLQSRGLTPTEAEELIVLGFFKQVIEQFPQEEVRPWLSEVVSRKVFRHT